MYKNYFSEWIDEIKAKLSSLPVGSIIRDYFPESRLQEISEEIEGSNCKDLELGYWQPFFLFLRNADAAAIEALENDLQMVMTRTSKNRENEFLELLTNKQECSRTWPARMFETFVKATFLNSEGISVSALDFKLPNGRDIDVKVQIGEREIGIECTTMGDSDADKIRWDKHCNKQKTDPYVCLYDSQDANTQGRRLYRTVYTKIACDFDLGKSQLCQDAPNLLLISFSPLLGELTPTSPAIRLALDELLSSQPTGNVSDLSLESWLSRQKLKSNIGDLLAAPRQLSGILLFCKGKLGVSRINYNAAKQISHSEMAFFENIFAQPAAYCH